ncbi:hypothetical protein BOX15_Mlig002709g1, partial [Macrostomum lignano]
SSTCARLFSLMAEAPADSGANIDEAVSQLAEEARLLGVELRSGAWRAQRRLQQLTERLKPVEAEQCRLGRLRVDAPDLPSADLLRGLAGLMQRNEMLRDQVAEQECSLRLLLDQVSVYQAAERLPELESECRRLSEQLARLPDCQTEASSAAFGADSTELLFQLKATGEQMELAYSVAMETQRKLLELLNSAAEEHERTSARLEDLLSETELEPNPVEATVMLKAVANRIFRNARNRIDLNKEYLGETAIKSLLQIIREETLQAAGKTNQLTESKARAAAAYIDKPNSDEAEARRNLEISRQALDYSEPEELIGKPHGVEVEPNSAASRPGSGNSARSCTQASIPEDASSVVSSFVDLISHSSSADKDPTTLQVSNGTKSANQSEVPTEPRVGELVAATDLTQQSSRKGAEVIESISKARELKVLTTDSNAVELAEDGFLTVLNDDSDHYSVSSAKVGRSVASTHQTDVDLSLLLAPSTKYFDSEERIKYEAATFDEISSEESSEIRSIVSIKPGGDSDAVTDCVSSASANSNNRQQLEQLLCSSNQGNKDRSSCNYKRGTCAIKADNSAKLNLSIHLTSKVDQFAGDESLRTSFLSSAVHREEYDFPTSSNTTKDGSLSRSQVSSENAMVESRLISQAGASLNEANDEKLTLTEPAPATVEGIEENLPISKIESSHCDSIVDGRQALGAKIASLETGIAVEVPLPDAKASKVQDVMEETPNSARKSLVASKTTLKNNWASEIQASSDGSIIKGASTTETDVLTTEFVQRAMLASETKAYQDKYSESNLELEVSHMKERDSNAGSKLILPKRDLEEKPTSHLHTHVMDNVEERRSSIAEHSILASFVAKNPNFSANVSPVSESQACKTKLPHMKAVMQVESFFEADIFASAVESEPNLQSDVLRTQSALEDIFTPQTRGTVEHEPTLPSRMFPKIAVLKEVSQIEAPASTKGSVEDEQTSKNQFASVGECCEEIPTFETQTLQAKVIDEDRPTSDKASLTLSRSCNHEIQSFPKQKPTFESILNANDIAKLTLTRKAEVSRVIDSDEESLISVTENSSVVSRTKENLASGTDAEIQRMRVQLHRLKIYA